MKVERIDAVKIEEHYLLSVDDLDDRWGLSRSQLQEFIAHGVLEPVGGEGAGAACFSLASVSVVQTACRLQRELELDPHAVGVVLGLLQRVHSLEQQVQALSALRSGPDGPEEAPPEADVDPLAGR